MSKKLRNIIFVWHRVIGLAIGLLFIAIGLTGSLLVFKYELDHLLMAYRFGRITPQPDLLSPEVISNLVHTAYANSHPPAKVILTDILSPTLPHVVWLNEGLPNSVQVFVNPHTGQILGDRTYYGAFFYRLTEYHYTLLAGNLGLHSVGVAGVLMMVMAITGLMLWPGWSKLIAGFKIKWNAHPKRLNFDIHKVIGFFSVAFLFSIAFTGLTLSYKELVNPLIYAIVSWLAKIPNWSNLKGEEVTGYLFSLHAGEFAGLPSRILYVFVGLAPLMLAVTGLNMFRLKRWGKAPLN